jgi:signal transduction histidine kinase
MAYIGTLASGLAHEIRNPLNSLNLNMQMLEEELDENGGTAPTGKRLLGHALIPGPAQKERPRQGGAVSAAFSLQIRRWRSCAGAPARPSAPGWSARHP